jgi:hypothetical protein
MKKLVYCVAAAAFLFCLMLSVGSGLVGAAEIDKDLTIKPPPPPAQPKIGPETCLGIDSNKLTIVGENSPVNPQSGAPGTWLLKLSNSKTAFVLAYSDTRADAERIISLIKAHHWNRVCWVGDRGGASFHYMLNASE